jgi:hypothetical protein
MKAALRSAFNAVARHLPVIGPHHTIEAELMLGGLKPLTWVSVYDENLTFDHHPDMQREHEGRKKMDAAVASGQMSSVDVTIRPKEPEAKEFIVRHYCQIGKEADMLLLAHFNQKMFNHEKPDVSLEKDIGEYLGYRKQDVWLWRNLGRLPRGLQKSVFELNEKVTQPAYQQAMLEKAAKSKPTDSTLPNPKKT